MNSIYNFRLTQFNPFSDELLSVFDHFVALALKGLSD